MKTQQPIPRQSKKIKRGTELKLTDTGETVYMYLERSKTCYIVSRDAVFRSADDLLEVKPSEIEIPGKARQPIKQTVKPLTDEKKEFKAELNVFFASQLLILPFLCENCGQPLQAFTSFEKRCTIAHILEKARFQSIACHPKNVMYLCAKTGCHALWDLRTAKERSEMKVYKLALERFKHLKPLLNQRELIQAMTYLNIKLK